ncbi:uncharacterized protein LOC129311549 [Prosopis cineraria]|uniref:uncharacterized protein LOC129311549 n=1 Tax=Prosopis cineraria TaxID=364024 RepID=UPI0024104F66|nr:uncharacterized protein LOC129311549 [Prosopis cineraria]
MAVSLTRFSCWLWGSKEKEPVSNSSTLNSSSDWGFSLKERETVKFPSVKGTKITASHRKVKRKWQSREQRRVDREYDVVLVPSDGGVCLSGSESDDSDWSIGWLEPHGSEFQSDDESDNSFAVLVPCYRPGCKEVESSKNELLSAIKNFPDEFSSGKNYLEHWLASLENFEA